MDNSEGFVVNLHAEQVRPPDVTEVNLHSSYASYQPHPEDQGVIRSNRTAGIEQIPSESGRRLSNHTIDSENRKNLPFDR